MEDLREETNDNYDTLPSPQEMENQTAECADEKPDISSLDHEENEDMGELSNAW
jgi:hypothetical protein